MTLDIGTIAPDFTLSDQSGEEITLSDAVEEGPVALVFFPLAFSGICTNELCELRDNVALFAEKGVRLFGISVDSVWTLKAFAASEGYDFSILSDFWPHGAIATDYGVFNEDAGIAERATFVIDAERRIRAVFETAKGQPRDLAAYRVALAELS